MVRVVPTQKSALVTLVVLFAAAVVWADEPPPGNPPPDYDDPCQYMDPDWWPICGGSGGGGGWYPCWDCAEKIVGGFVVLRKCCRGEGCTQDGYRRIVMNLSNCQLMQINGQWQCRGQRC